MTHVFGGDLGNVASAAQVDSDGVAQSFWQLEGTGDGAGPDHVDHPCLLILNVQSLRNQKELRVLFP